MASTEVVRTRIESELKASATEILEGMGVTVSQAIRMLLVQSEGAERKNTSSDGRNRPRRRASHA